MKSKRFCSVVVALATVFLMPLPSAGAEAVVEARCLVAAQAKFVFEDPEVKSIFQAKGLNLTVQEANTSQMVAAAAGTNKPDCVLLSSEAGVTLLRNRGVQFNDIDKDYVFKTYPVSVIRGDLVEALTQLGVLSQVSSDDGSTRLGYTDFGALVKAALDGKKWSELPGFDSLDAGNAAKVKGLRNVKLFSTSPVSNSGLFVAITFGTIRADADILTAESWALVMPDVKRYFAGLGAKPIDAGKLLSEFLSSRSKPIVIVYESQVIEFALALKAVADQGDTGAAAALGNLTKYARLVYFEPTLDANHPVVALSDVGRQVLAAMKDPSFRLVAWDKHGFRPFAIGGEVDVKHLATVLPGVVSVPLQVNVLPEEAVQDAIKESLK